MGEEGGREGEGGGKGGRKVVAVGSVATRGSRRAVSCQCRAGVPPDPQTQENLQRKQRRGASKHLSNPANPSLNPTGGGQ
jgi:hypothetical protein